MNKKTRELVRIEVLGHDGDWKAFEVKGGHVLGLEKTRAPCRDIDGEIQRAVADRVPREPIALIQREELWGASEQEELFDLIEEGDAFGPFEPDLQEQEVAQQEQQLLPWEEFGLQEELVSTNSRVIQEGMEDSNARTSDSWPCSSHLSDLSSEDYGLDADVDVFPME